MAINYWVLGGKPTSYNTLPGPGNKVVIPMFRNYTLTFRAKSPSGAKIRVSSWNVINDLNVDQITTPDFQTYTFSWYESEGGQLFIYDLNSVGDIIIDSISLVQAPLPKLTINGLDGFNSGKWVPSSNSSMTVNDDSSVTMNATSSWASVSLSFIPVLPNTKYDLTVLCSDGGIRADEYASDKTTNTAQNNGDYTQSSLTFTTQSNTYYLIIYLGNGALGAGSFTFKQPLLNLGTTPAPYSPKTGDRMVMPTPKKNLFNINGNINTGVTGVTATYPNTQDGVSVSTFNGYSDTNAIGQMVTLVVGQTYTLSAISQMCGDNIPSRLRVKSYDGTVTPVTLSYASSQQVQSATFTATVSNYVIDFCRIGHNSTVYPALFSNVQFEQGTVATPYAPYAVQENKLPQKYVPKKNLFDGQMELGYIDPTTGNNVAYSTRTRSVNYLTINGNTSYYLSTPDNELLTDFRVMFYDSNKSFISSFYTYISSGNYSYSFTTPTNCKYIRFTNAQSTNTFARYQIEQGSTATPYEPYQLVLPPANKGLSFNGVTDYLQLPSMTMDSVEIEATIDPSVANSVFALFVDARSGLAGSGNGNDGFFGKNNTTIWGDGTYVTSVLINGQTVTNSWSNLQLGQRTRYKMIANAPFTDDVTIFARFTHDLYFTKAILYKVTCYLNGSIVAQYDFTNPNNIVGNTVFQNAQNLIPSFEDVGWTLDPNTTLLGKDVLHLNANSSANYSHVTIPVLPNTTYLYQAFGTGRIDIDQNHSDGSKNTSPPSVVNNGSTYTFTTDSNTVSVSFDLYGGAIGSFDFIRPQLYQLDGTEGMINGNPIQLNKPSKRSLYAKR